MEDRWGMRLGVHAAAELRTADGVSAIATVKNTSLSGAFLETDAHTPPRSQVSVRPISKEGEWLEAIVVRVEEKGIAIEWLEPGIHALYVLKSGRPTNG